DNYIKIWTDPSLGNRHNGVWDEGKYRLSGSGGYRTAAIIIEENYVHLEGLQAEWISTGSGVGVYNIVGTLSGETFFDSCIGKMQDNTGTHYDLFIFNTHQATDLSAHTVKAINCVAYSTTSGDYRANAGFMMDHDVTAYIYNCVVSNIKSHGIWSYGSGTTITAKNCVAFNNGDDFYSSSSGSLSIDYCASDDGDGTNEVNWANEATDWANVFTDYANGDFHLKNFTGTGAIIDQGDNLTAQGFTDDIDGQGRGNGDGWDIGADEYTVPIYRSVGPSATSALDDDNSHNDTLTISSGTATFSSAAPDNVGVGDVVLYDSNNDDSLTSADSIAFIKSRTDSTHYILQTETGATPADLSANDTWAIYRAYTSLANAESGIENTSIPISFTGGNRDLVTNNEQWNIACYNGEGGAADETAVRINGWTTSSANYLRIYTPIDANEVGASQRHSGKWDEGKYRLEDYLRINENYVRIEGLQFKGPGRLWIDYIDSGGSNLQFGYLVMSGNAVNYDGVGYADADATGYLYNSVIYDYGIDGGLSRAAVNAAYGSLTCMNVTVDGKGKSGNHKGFRGNSGVATAYNCVAVGYGSEGWYNTWSGYNDATDQATDDQMPATGGVYSIAPADSFIDYSNSDYHLKSTDTDLKDAGADLSSDPDLSFSDDIDGDTRPSDVGDWDIGSDEAMPPTVINFSNTSTINSSQTDKMTDGLVLMQSFDGNHMDWSQSTAEARDQSGQGNHGDVVGATAAIGKIGQALNFDGSGNYVSQGNVSDGIHTVAFWIKADDLTDRKVMDLNGTEQIEIDGTGNIAATNFPGTTTIYIDGTASSALTAGWHHIVITNTAGVNASAMDIGRVSAGYFDGELDEVRLYTRVLSSDEIGDLYRMGRVTFRK
ncbi:LamG domain-containing protein, partial [bacterium]|nr:LamG domain-containing protein [bacterium]